MRHYCTLFDSKYLTRGLALYESLVKHSSEPFCLNVLCMDEECYATLAQMGLPRSIEMYSLSECGNLDEIRSNRTWKEFCWTMASQFTETLMDRLTYPSLTYLDADLFFFSDPAPVFDEIGSRSIAITPHRLIPSKQHLSVNGTFNVGWVTFKNTPVGRECLSRWAAQCRERCSAEVGCGDQGYLTDWPERYGDEVCILSKGVNVAPWNVGNWNVELDPDGSLFVWEPVEDKPWTQDWHNLACFHFHELRPNADGSFYLSGYELREADKRLIYQPYIESLKAAQKQIETVHLQQH